MSTITVSTTADAGNGSLRNAITTAESGDTIKFSEKLARKTIKLESGQLTLDENLTIDGGDAPGLVISGNNKSRVFYLEKKRKANLKNLTIADGKTKGAGGGIETRHESEITLEKVKVHNNTSELGGGMRVGHKVKATIIDSSFKGNDGKLTSKHKGFSAGAISQDESRGQLIVKDTEFTDNKGYVGGAIYSFSSVSLVVEDSKFKDNVGDEGGAIFTDGVSSKGYESGLANDGKLIIRGSEFVGNQAKGGGGAIYAWGYTKKQGYKNDQAIIEDSKFVDNVVSANKEGRASGGAIWAKMGLEIRNATFSDNTADKQGGALWTETNLPIDIVNSTFSKNRAVKDAGGAMFLNNRSTPVKITNSTIFENTAGRANGALWFTKDHNVTLKNSIVASNTASDRRQDQVGYQPNDGGGNLEFGVSSKALKLFDNSVVADPLLEPLTSVKGSLVHALDSDSPAIDAGINKGAPDEDQRGVQRDNRVDIGAFELGGNSFKPIAAEAKLVTKSVAEPITKSVSMAAPTFSSGNVKPSGDNKTQVAYLNLNEGKGGRAKDRSGSGSRNDGRLSGGVKWTEDGKKGGALDFDGKNDLVKLKDSQDINRGTHKERTISLWFNADNINAGGKKQVIYEEGGSGRGMNIYLDGGELHVGAWNRDSNQSDWSGTWLKTQDVSAKEWHHVSLVLDGDSTVSQNALHGYIDGRQFGSGEGSQLWDHGGNIGLGSINQGTRFRDGTASGRGSSFDGKIDEVMIFNDALKESEVKALL